MLGTTELLLLGGLALLIFGGKKVPEMMRGLGQGVKEFKNGMKDVNETIESVKKDITSSEVSENNTSNSDIQEQNESKE
ncbi:MAG: twin-arginine translocase TatA/TatE family subunit [Bacteroidaceae bacterium]|nr:twin-arginine translocase TatA/TatE family subunit [Bacteroidaceae bacterium]